MQANEMCVTDLLAEGLERAQMGVAVELRTVAAEVDAGTTEPKESNGLGLSDAIEDMDTTEKQVDVVESSRTNGINGTANNIPEDMNITVTDKLVRGSTESFENAKVQPNANRTHQYVKQSDDFEADTKRVQMDIYSSVTPPSTITELKMLVLAGNNSVDLIHPDDTILHKIARLETDDESGLKTACESTSTAERLVLLKSLGIRDRTERQEPNDESTAIKVNIITNYFHADYCLTITKIAIVRDMP